MQLQLLLVSIEESTVTGPPKKKEKGKGMLECMHANVPTNGK